MEARRQRHCIISVLRKSHCQLRALYPPPGMKEKDSPGGPVVQTLPSNAKGMGSIPGQGVDIPRSRGSKKPEHKTKLIRFYLTIINSEGNCFIF